MIFFFLISFSSSAQEKITFADLDVGTYQLYEKAKWKELIDLGQAGLDSGIDYYYLRIRMGIAEFNIKHYQSAIPHFRKALKFSESDPLALEYLYYSLLWSGRKQEARLIVQSMPAATRKKIGVSSNSSLKGVFLEGGQVAVMDLDSLINFQPEGFLVDHYLLKNYLYVSGGLELDFGERFTMRAGLNYMKFSALQQLSVPSPVGMQIFDFDHQNTQTGLYLGGEWTLHPNWYLGLAGHFIKGDYNYMEYSPGMMMGQSQFARRWLNYRDFVLEGSLSHRFQTVQAGINASYFNLGDQSGTQTGLDITWYPFGNLNLYLQAHSDWVIPLETDEYEGSWVWQGMAGMKIFRYLWIEAHAGAGRMAGWSEKSAYIVYNNQDPILLRSGINIIIPDITKGFSLTFRYQLQQREHSWEIDKGEIEVLVETNKYLNNSIIGGVLWKF